MAERDKSLREPLFSDVPGDRERVREILARWGVEESSIRELLSGPTGGLETPPRPLETPPAGPKSQPPHRPGH